MIIVVLFFTSFLHASIGSELSYSRACVAGQCGDWKQAQQQMSNLVIDNPDRAELLYDNGVAAFRLQEFEKARAYFGDVVKNMHASAPLQKQAHFNLGNTQVALNEFSEAIKEYEAVLVIDPHDERAQHNLQKVRELLAQKQEEQEQQQNQDGDSQGDQQNSPGDQQDSQSGGDDANQDNAQSGEQGKSMQGDGQNQKDDNSQSDSDSSKQKEKGKSDSDQDGDQEDQADSQLAGEDQDQQEDQFGNGHDSSPEGDQDEEANDANNVASEQQKKQDTQDDVDKDENSEIVQADDAQLDKDLRAEEQKKMQQKFAPNEQWMARLLQRRDKADDQANKQLIKATVDKNMAGKHGQNNW